MWRKANPFALLVGMQIGAATVESSIEIPQKIKNDLYFKKLYNFMIKNKTALAVVAQWIELWPVNQKVTGSIPSQDTLLDCRPAPQRETAN